MTWSLNEVEALSRKAARGTGLSWGLAEEAGRAARWLAGFGLPGPQVLADLLTQNDGMEYATLCPVDTEGVWTAEGGRLCPLITGAALCDHAERLTGGGEIRLGETAYPLLLLPYAAAAADMAGTAVEMTWPGLCARLEGDAMVLGERGGLTSAGEDSITLRAVDGDGGAPCARVSRAAVPGSVATRLAGFAHRTYAPATPESRAGAGSGLSDND